MLAGIYVLAAAYFIFTQGLFGESFISIILGMPWTLALSVVEFGGAEGPALYALVIAPMVLNALLLYWIGSVLGKVRRTKMPEQVQPL